MYNHAKTKKTLSLFKRAIQCTVFIAFEATV